MVYLSDIRGSYSFEGERFVANFFENMQLPIPNAKNQYLRSHAGSKHLFLNRYGCHLRLTNIHASARTKGQPSDVAFTNHKRQLQPFASKVFEGEYSQLRLDLFPGVFARKFTGTNIPFLTQLKANSMLSTLHESGITTTDPNLGNFGTLPIRTPASPNGVEVILDPGGVELVSVPSENPFKQTPLQEVFVTVTSLTERLRARHFTTCEDNEDPQKILYGRLADTFAQAWPDDHKNADPEGIKEFLEYGRETKDRRLSYLRMGY